MTTSSRTSHVDSLRSSVLILEDDPLQALALEDAVNRAGLKPLAASDCETACRHVASCCLSAGILDIGLRHHLTSFSVAVELDRVGVPFLFVSGYGADAIPETLRSRPYMVKPWASDELIRALRAMISAARMEEACQKVG
ncbi:MAG TPA: hypothetical protein VJR58_22915 [Vineibacter sp.]|nr:hypothetical protein [Vineibacter sp.]